MTKVATLSPRAAMAMGVIMGYVQPRLKPTLAMDEMPNFRRMVAGTTALNYKERKPEIVKRLVALTKGKLAMDADLKDVVSLLDKLDGNDKRGPETMSKDDMAPMDRSTGEATLEGEESNMLDPEDTDDLGEDDEGDPSEQIKTFLESKGMSPEDIEHVCAMLKPADAVMAGEEAENDAAASKLAEGGKKPEDEVPAKDKRMMTKPAMDAAIAASAKGVETRLLARMKAVREAERAVRPFVGDVVLAMDSADDIYAYALEKNGVKVKGVHPSAFPAMLAILPKPGSTPASPSIAMDAKAISGLNDRFPGATRVRVLG